MLSLVVDDVTWKMMSVFVGKYVDQLSIKNLIIRTIRANYETLKIFIDIFFTIMYKSMMPVESPEAVSLTLTTKDGNIITRKQKKDYTHKYLVHVHIRPRRYSTPTL